MEYIVGLPVYTLWPICIIPSRQKKMVSPCKHLADDLRRSSNNLRNVTNTFPVGWSAGIDGASCKEVVLSRELKEDPRIGSEDEIPGDEGVEWSLIELALPEGVER